MSEPNSLDLMYEALRSYARYSESDMVQMMKMINKRVSISELAKSAPKTDEEIANAKTALQSMIEN